MDIRYSSNPNDVKRYTTEELRKEFLIQDLYQPDQVKATYSHVDRMVVLGILPVTKEVSIDQGIDVWANFGTAGTLGGARHGQEGGLIGLVGGGGHQIEPGGSGAVRAGEGHVLGAHGDIQAVLEAQIVLLPIHGDGAGAAQVEHASTSPRATWSST